MKSKAKPYTPYNHCDKCNFNYPHYNSTLTKCPRCEELKNELKGNNYVGKIRTREDTGKIQKSKIKSERAGRNLRKLTIERRGRKENSELESGETKRRKVDTYRIPKKTSKQAEKDKTIAKIKQELIAEQDEICYTCGKYGNVELSHIIPRSKRPDLATEKRNCILQDRQCHEALEHLDVFKIRKFKNLNYILETIQSLDQSRYVHVMTALDNQLIASR